MKFGNIWFSKDIDKTLASLGLIFALPLIVFLFIYAPRIVFILPVFFSIFSFLTWFLIRNDAKLNFAHPYPKSFYLIVTSIFFILFLASILSLHFRSNLYVVPLLFFIIVSFNIAILFHTIIFSNRIYNFLVIFQIILVGISLVCAQILIYPSLVGVDPWVHEYLSLNIINNHFILGDYPYSRIPLFHLFIVSTSLISGLDYKFASLCSASLSQIICNVMFVFLLGKFLFNSSKVGLLSSLMLIIANVHIFMSYWTIPNSLAAVFILPIFYLSLKMRNNKPIISSMLCILFMVCIILTHSVTSICMAMILFIFYFGVLIYNKLYLTEFDFSFNYAMLFSVFMFGWWSFASGHIATLANLIKWGFSIDFFIHAPTEVIVKVQNLPVFEQLFNNIGMFLFFSLSFIGCLYMISTKYGNYATFSLAIVGLSPLAISFFSIITDHSVIAGRWWYFAQILLAIPVAVAISLLYNITSTNCSKRYLLIGFVILLSFCLIFSNTANISNNKFSPNTQVRAAFTASELQAINTTSDIWDQTIKADYYYSKCMSYSKYNIQNFDNELYYNNISSLQGELVLIRKEILENPFTLFGYVYKLDYNIIHKYNDLQFSKIYDCGSVYGFLKF